MSQLDKFSDGLKQALSRAAALVAIVLLLPVLFVLWPVFIVICVESSRADSLFDKFGNWRMALDWFFIALQLLLTIGWIIFSSYLLYWLFTSLFY